MKELCNNRFAINYVAKQKAHRKISDGLQAQL